MADALEELLRACTVRVLGPRPGAGFFIAPGIVLTCAHVVGAETSVRIDWDSGAVPAHPARVLTTVAELGRPIPKLDSDYPDVALIGVEGLDGHPCVAIDSEWPQYEDQLQIYGYPEEGGSVLLTPAILAYRGLKGSEPTLFLDLASDKVKPGMSGAPVLNLRSRAVCGLVVASKDVAAPDGALAVAWSSMGDALAHHIPGNMAFHQTDSRWHTAAALRRSRIRFRLPRVAAHFAGRETALANLDAALRASGMGVNIQALTGLGGVGKTQLAAAYIAGHADEFDIVAWMRAEDGGVADLAALAVELGLPAAERTPAERADATWTYLAVTERSWLLVLDNVANPNALKHVPMSGRGRVLVTSRHRGGYAPFGRELEVEVFDQDTATEYLVTAADRPAERDDARAVATALGGLPLALAHAGAYCRAGAGARFADYLELLENLPAEEVFDRSHEVFYEQTVHATWRTSVAAAGGDAPLAPAVLEMASYLAPDAIPRSLLEVLDEKAVGRRRRVRRHRGVDASRVPIDVSAATRKRIHDALAALDRFSLAEVNEATISVHGLVQKVIRDAAGNSAAGAWAALEAMVSAMPGDNRSPAQWPRYQELVPHVMALARTVLPAPARRQGLISCINECAAYLIVSGDHTTAKQCAELAVARSEALLGTDHPATLTARRTLAISYESAGRSAEAIAIGERVVADSERLLGPDHNFTLTARGDVALSYASVGRAAEATAIREQVVADSERLLGPDHPDTLTALANLAMSYESAGRSAEAIAIGERVVAGRERRLGRDHPDTLTARGNLAVYYRSAGRTTEPIAIQERLVADCERLLGPEHPYTLTALANLAMSYESAGRSAEAIDIGERVVAGRERRLGPDHPSTLTAENNLAASYSSGGRMAEAIAIQERVVAGSERRLGPDHPSTVTAWTNLGTFYCSAGRTAEAIAIQERADADMARLLGDEHPSTLDVRAALAISYRATGRTAEAIAIMEQVVAGSERALGASHPNTVTRREDLAMLTTS